MRTILLTTVLFIAACGSASTRKREPSRPVDTDVEGERGAEIDNDVARLFLDPKLIGSLPSNFKWSPDGGAVAFIRKPASRERNREGELWLYDLKRAGERPLAADQALPIFDYCWVGSERLVFLSGGDLYSVDLGGKMKRLTDSAEQEMSVDASGDGTRVAFARGGNLFSLRLDTGEEQQITTGGTPDRYFGEVTWVYQEEFDTPSGFGWSPKGGRLWFYYTDTTDVTHAYVAGSSDDVSLQAYPRPGEPNPTVRVGVVDLSKKGASTVWLETGSDADIYLPRVVWHPDSRRIVVARMDRLQTLLDLLLCDSDNGKCESILEERDPRWVNLMEEPKFIKNGKEILWLSERDGFSHIYRFGIDGLLNKQITSGQWSVTSIGAADEQNDRVFFTANAERPVAYGIYSVSLSGGEVEGVSPEQGTHDAVFSPDGKHYVDRHSALDRLPRVEVHKSSGELVSAIDEADFGNYKSKDVTTEMFEIEADDGQTLMAIMTRPVELEPGRRYPVLINTYGGPGWQLVLDSFNTRYQPWHNLLASRGVLVFSVDGRGSAGRGHEFECAVHRRLGELELKDQLAGVRYLKAQPYVDPDRLAIFGWSYGGTMVLNALLRTKGVFRAGVAVAPVTDWSKYDTAYTERYMQRPSDNPDGYEGASLLGRVKNLETPLLLIHGLSDDNVHFDNSALMVNALIDAGKSFDVMFYPGKSHDISGAKTRADLFSRITRFVEKHLK